MAKSFKKAIDQTGLGKGIGGVFSSTENKEPEKEKATPATQVTGDARQTFVLDADKLEYLKDYAYENRVTQKEALEEAIELLKQQYGAMPPRPDSAREREQKRGKRS